MTTACAVAVRGGRPTPAGGRAIGAPPADRDGPKTLDAPHEAMAFFLRQRLPPGQETLPLEHLRAERDRLQLREAAQRRTRTPRAPAWSSIGPGNIGGRTRALVFDPVDPDVMYGAGVAGGVWKTTDGGLRWSTADDFMLNLAVCSLAIDPADPSVLYAGTGEGYYLSDVFVRGLGIFKSTDGGATFAQLPGTVTGVPAGSFHFVNDIVVSPNDSRRVYAATRTGVWRSLDAGVTWSVALANPYYNSTPPTSNGNTIGCTDLAIRSDRNPDTVLAAFGGIEADGVFRSTDGGATWQAPWTRPGNQGRTSIALAPSNNDVVYLLVSDNGNGGQIGQLVDVFRSTDGGTTFTPQVDFGTRMGPWLLSNLALATGCYPGGTYAQGWYDLTLAVDPMNPDVVWVGGIDLFRSDDGGRTYGIAGYWFYYMASPPPPDYIHPDQHVLVFHPQYDGVTNQTMLMGNDGGIFRTDNAAAATGIEDCPFPPDEPTPAIVWQGMNNGYGVTQFYHGDAAADRDMFVGGAQDNGTSRVLARNTPDAWKMIFGGDGGYVAIDPRDSQVVYVEYQGFPTIQKSTDGGATFRPAVAGITDTDGVFITPFAMDPTDPDNLWTGGRRPWRTTNGAGLWRVAGPNLAGPDQITAIAVAPSSSDVVYLGFGNGYVARTTNGLAASPTWTFSRSGLPSTWCSSVAVDPLDVDVAYATYSTYGGRHVFRTQNGGQTWTSIDGIGYTGVPDIPVHWVAVRPCNTLELYAGTELGVFWSDDGGTTWQPGNVGLAHTVVESLDFQDDDTLVAFSHGRGAFVSSLTPCSGTGTIQEVVMAPGAGPANPPRVRGADGSGTTLPIDFLAYGVPAFGANVGAAAIASTVPREGSLLTGPGPGDVFGPHVKGFARDGTPIAKVSFYAYGTLRFGVRPAGGDVDGDAFGEIVTGPGPGAVFGPHVRGFDVDSSTLSSIPGCSFYAYATLKYGVGPAAADVDLGGRGDIVTGPGPGAVFGPHVRGFSLAGAAVQPITGLSFFAFSGGTHGAVVSGGDVDGDGFHEIYAGRGPAPAAVQQIRLYDFDGTAVAAVPGGDVTPFPYAYGAAPGASDVDGDASAELLAGPGPDPAAPTALRGYDLVGSTLVLLPALSIDLHGVTYGLKVAGADLGY